MAKTSLSSTSNLASVTTGTSFQVSPGKFNATISGTFVGTVKLQRSFDNGATWQDCYDTAGTLRSYTAPRDFVLDEAEPALYRWNMTARTSGTAVCRLGQAFRRSSPF